MKTIRKSMGLLVLVLLLVSLPACTLGAITPAPVVSATPGVTEPISIETFEDAKAIFKEIRNAPPEWAQQRADALWQTLTDGQRVPLVLGTQVIFLYKGVAQQVSWSGSFNSWDMPGLEGVRVGETDLWIAYIELPAASRAEYKIILDGREWMVDPANSHTAYSGLTGENNAVTLPGFSVTDESKKRNNVQRGTLTGDLLMESTSLGYTVNYWVYTPVGYEEMNHLPVIYVLDGNDFVDERMGAMPNILDNLISDRRIEPVLAVFVDAREPGNPQHNRREEEFLARPMEHAQFIADELVAVIDRMYHTNPQPDARLITGVSYGGISASFIGASRSDVFHNLAAFSPTAEHVTDPKMIEGLQIMAPIMNAVVECDPATDFTCPRLPLKIFFSWGIPAWDVGDLSGTISDLQRANYPVAYYQVSEGHSWDNWRGLTDEMLIYFFGTD